MLYMIQIANFLVWIVALAHIYFLVLEMFLWTTPIGLKVFGQSLEKAQTTKVLAANQGLYNGFLAAGLIWGVSNLDPIMSYQLKMFFLGCVVIAGVFGALTVSKKIFFVQALPALIAIALTAFARLSALDMPLQ